MCERCNGDIFTPEVRARLDALLEEARHLHERPEIIAGKAALDAMLAEMRREDEAAGEADGE